MRCRSQKKSLREPKKDSISLIPCQRKKYKEGNEKNLFFKL